MSGLLTEGRPADPAAPRADARPPARSVPRWVRMVAGALLVLVLADVAVRWLEPGITPTDRYGVVGAMQKAAQVEALGRTGPVDVVFAGTSQTLLGIDPEAVAAAAGSGVRAYNAALPGLTPVIQGDWLLDEVVPALDPRLVVIGVSSLDLAETSPRLDEVVESWRAAPAHRDDLLGRVERAVAARVPLVEHREALRQPAEWLRAARRRLQGRDAPIPDRVTTLTDLGMDRVWWDVEYQGHPGLLRWMRTQVVPGYTIGDEHVAALAALLADLRARGIQVALLEMPITDDLVAMHPRGEADVAAARAVFEDVAGRLDVPVLRVADHPWPEHLFSDPIHLNGRGTEVLSDLVGRQVAFEPVLRLDGGDHSRDGDEAVAAALARG